jgi:ribonuclease J
MLEGVPDLITRGLAVESGADSPLHDASRLITELVETASLEERTDYGMMKDKISVELRRFFRKRLGQRPLVLPVIMEI